MDMKLINERRFALKMLEELLSKSVDNYHFLKRRGILKPLHKTSVLNPHTVELDSFPLGKLVATCPVLADSQSPITVRRRVGRIPPA